MSYLNDNNKYDIADKVNRKSLIGVTNNDLTTIEVEIVRVTDLKTHDTKAIAYQIKDGLIVAEGPELEKYIPSRGNGIGWIKPYIPYDANGWEVHYVLECDDLEGYTGRHVACIWPYWERRVTDNILDEYNYNNRPLAFKGDVYVFFRPDMLEISADLKQYSYIAQKCQKFMQDNPGASIDSKSEFIRNLLNKSYRALRYGHIHINGSYDINIFEQINMYLKFDAERKEQNKAKKHAAERAKKAAKRAARAAKACST